MLSHIFLVTKTHLLEAEAHPFAWFGILASETECHLRPTLTVQNNAGPALVRQIANPTSNIGEASSNNSKHAKNVSVNRFIAYLNETLGDL